MTTLGSFLVPFGSFLLTWVVHFLTFAVSWPHFSYFSVFSTKISCKIILLHNFHLKSHSQSTKSYFPEACRTHPNRKYILSCNLSSRAQSGTFASGNLEPLRARRRPGRVSFCCGLSFSTLPFSTSPFKISPSEIIFAFPLIDCTLSC